MFCKSSTLAETRNVMNEKWKDVKGYEGLYQVSNLGRVKTFNYKNHGTEELLALTDNDGYYTVHICGEKRPKVHRWVAEAFIPNPNNLPEVNHKDEDGHNNCVDNLEWCTSIYNNNYGTRNKRIAEKLSRPVLQFTLDGAFVKEWASTRDIERSLGIMHTCISSCCLGKYKQSHGYVWKYKQPEAV